LTREVSRNADVLDDIQRAFDEYVGPGGPESRQQILQTLAKRLQSLEEAVAKVSGDLATELEKDLFRRVLEVARSVAQHEADIEKNRQFLQNMEAVQRSFGEHLKRHENRSLDLEVKEEKLRLRADMLDAHFCGLANTTKEAAVKLDTHALEMERARARQQQLDCELGAANSTLQALSSEVGSTHRDVAYVTSRLDLAHDYIDGIGKGLKDTHRHVLGGTGGMLAPRNGRTGTLPGLHPSPPMPQGAPAMAPRITSSMRPH